MGQFDPKFQVEGGVPHQPFYVSEKLHEFIFHGYKNLGGTFVRFVTIHVCDGQTDRRTYMHICSAVKSIADSIGITTNTAILTTL